MTRANEYETLTPHFMYWPIPHGLTTTDDPMQEWQDNRCAMCGYPDGRTLDHDHETGLTRGWLCRSCNAREGKSYEPIWMLWRAGLNPARMFGWEEPYESPFSWRDAVMRGPASSDTMRRGAEAAGRIG